MGKLDYSSTDGWTKTIELDAQTTNIKLQTKDKYVNQDITINTHIPKETADLIAGGGKVKGKLSAISANGTASTLSLTAGTSKQLTIDNKLNCTDDTAFTITGGGIQCNYSGNVMVSGSVYIGMTGTASYNNLKGCYIKNGATEITSAYSFVNYAAGAANAPVIATTVSAGDVITLWARSSIATSCYPNNGATHLDIIYLSQTD